MGSGTNDTYGLLEREDKRWEFDKKVYFGKLTGVEKSQVSS